MADDLSELPDSVSSYAVYMRLALAPWTMYFLNEKSIDRKTMDLCDNKICKTMIKKTARHQEVRYYRPLSVSLCFCYAPAKPSQGKHWVTMPAFGKI